MGAAWSVGATAVNYGSSIIAFLITARFLGVERFGQFGVVNSTTGVFGILAGMGMGLTATRYVAELRMRDPVRAGRIIGMTLLATATSSVVLCALLLVASNWVAGLLKAPSLSGTLRISTLVLLFSAINNAQNGVLSGFEEFRSLARNNIVRGALSLPIQVACVWYWGLTGAVFGTAATHFIGCVLNWRSINRCSRAAGITIAYRRLRSELAILWSFSFPTTIAGLMSVLLQWVTNALLTHQPNGFVELGYLNAAYNWRALVTFLPFTVASAALPAITALASSDEGSQRDGEEFRGLETANALNQMVLWPVAVGTMLLGGWIMRSYGKDFGAGTTVFITLVGGTAIGYVGNSVGTLILSEGRTWLAVLQNSAFGLLLLAIAFAGASRFGALAVSVGTAVAYFVLMVCTVLYMRHHGKVSNDLSIRLIGGGVTMAILTALLAVLPPAAGPWLFVPGTIGAAAFSLTLMSPHVRRSGVAWLRRARHDRLTGRKS